MIKTQLEMTSSPPKPKSEKRKIVEFFRSGTRKVKDATTVWKRTSDEAPQRVSVFSKESGSRYSEKSEYMRERFLDNESGKGEFDADQSWDTHVERYSRESDTDRKWNLQGKGAWELAEDYRNLIGKHPFEIELEIQHDRKVKESVNKAEIARKAREVEEARAVEEAALERKRRQWRERQEAIDRAKGIDKEEKDLRAAAAKHKREREQAAFRQESIKMAEARKIESNVSGITTWSKIMGSGNSPKLGQTNMETTTGRVNMMISRQPTTSPSGSGPPNRMFQDGASFTTSTSQPSSHRQNLASESLRNIPAPLNQQVLHDLAARLAVEKLNDMHQNYTRESDQPPSSRDVSEELLSPLNLPQHERRIETPLSQEKRAFKSRTWPKNTSASVKQSNKRKELPNIYMVNGRWVGQSKAESQSSGASDWHGSTDSVNMTSTHPASRQSDPNYRQDIGYFAHSAGASPFNAQFKNPSNFTDDVLSRQQTAQNLDPASQRFIPKKWTESSKDGPPLFSDSSIRQNSNSSTSYQQSPPRYPQRSMTTPINIPTSKKFDSHSSNDFETYNHGNSPLRSGQSSGPKDGAPPIPERSPRRRQPH
jgi:hypothetical protein